VTFLPSDVEMTFLTSWGSDAASARAAALTVHAVVTASIRRERIAVASGRSRALGVAEDNNIE
jgi:hypothetical protein